MRGARFLRVRLWMKLALAGAVGIAAAYTLAFVLSSRVASAALTRELESSGQAIAGAIARVAADAILVGDLVGLEETVANAVGAGGVAYCFIVRDEKVLVSSFGPDTPGALAALRHGLDARRGPIVVRSSAGNFLDVSEPVFDGTAGSVRIGMDLGRLTVLESELLRDLAYVAAALIVLGLVAAFVIGRALSRPLAEMLVAADGFQPGRALPPLRVNGGSDEIAELAHRFRQMMFRLNAAHEEQERALEKTVQMERLVALGSLVSGVAHEVNNPLAGLMNCHRMLARDDLKEERRQEYLALMRDALDRIHEVVKQLLDLGRPRPLTLVEVPVFDLARESASLIGPLLDTGRGIRLEEHMDAGCDGARVLADRHQIAQAALNLLLNAAYVTPDGGSIRIATRRRPGYVGLAIEDSGPGIPPEIRSRIFDPFFTTKPAGEGTGLGLSVTRSIIGAHGGELDFEFPERGGTIVTIWLPEVRPGAAAQLGTAA